MNSIKDQLLSRCEAWVNDRVSHLTRELAELRETLKDETKSSAGDKYETTRAMTHLDMEKLAGQLAEAEKMNQVLLRIRSVQPGKMVDLGSLVKTDGDSYFLSVSMGKTEVQGHGCICLSPISPLGSLLMGKKKGDVVKVAHRSLKITEIL